MDADADAEMDVLKPCRRIDSGPAELKDEFSDSLSFSSRAFAVGSRRTAVRRSRIATPQRVNPFASVCALVSQIEFLDLY